MLILQYSYNIYDECGADNRRRELSNGENVGAIKSIFKKLASKSVTVETESSFKVSAGYSDALNDYECGGHTAMNEYLAGKPSLQLVLCSYCTMITSIINILFLMSNIA